MNKNTGKPLLLGLLRKKTSKDGSITIEFVWLRILLFFLVLIITIWLSIASLLFCYFKYSKEFYSVKFSNMLILPFKYKDHLKEMGDYHISSGLKEIENQKIANGLRLLRLGLARSQGNLDGIVMLAQIYEKGLDRKDIATEMYIKGFDHNGLSNDNFVQHAIESLLRNKMDKQIDEIALKYLPSNYSEGDNENILKLAYAASVASFYRGNFDKSEDYIDLFQLNETIDGIILSSKISWDRGNKLAAINKLESSLYKFGNHSLILAQISQYYRENKDFTNARRYAKLRNVKDPSNHSALLDLIYLYHDFDNHEELDKMIMRYVKNFNDNQDALYLLANFSAKTGDVDLAQTCYELALEKNYILENFSLTLIESHLVKKDYQGAINFSEELLLENPDWLQNQWSIFNSLRALASYGLNRPDLGEIYLLEFLNEDNIPADTYVSVAKRFISSEMYKQAHTILNTAFTKEENNQRVLNDLIRVNLILGKTENLGSQIKKLLKTRRPNIDLLHDAYQRIGSDLFLFTKNRNSILVELSSILKENNRIN